MTIALANIVVKHERRLRLLFTNTLATGAFVPGPYVITADQGASPNVLTAYVVSGAGNCVELALDGDLSQFAIYTISALSVPATDASFTGSTPDSGNTSSFSIAGAPAQPNAELPADDLDALLFGEDFVFDGVDYIETDQGDLATISGRPNYQAAIQRRVAQDLPLPYDASYGEQPGTFVNGPSPLASTLSGKAKRQALADDRTKSATVTFAPSPSKPSQMVLQLQVTPIGDTSGAQPLLIDLTPGS